MTSPHLTPELFDKYTLAGTPSPGVVTFSGLERLVGWDKKDASGQDGASTARKGTKLAQFSAAHYLVHDPYNADQDEFAEWGDFVPLLESTYGGDSPQALDLYHPEVARLKIKAVVVESISAIVPDGKGGGTATVKYIEYSPPKAKTSTGPTGSKATPGKAPAAPDPNAAAKEELAALLQLAKDPNT